MMGTEQMTLCYVICQVFQFHLAKKSCSSLANPVSSMDFTLQAFTYCCDLNDI